MDLLAVSFFLLAGFCCGSGVWMNETIVPICYITCAGVVCAARVGINELTDSHLRHHDQRKRGVNGCIVWFGVAVR